MKWGEVWTVAGGPGYAGKPRPAVILQNELYLDATVSTTICMFTTDPRETQFERPMVDPDSSNGISDRSFLMVDKIATVPRAKMKKRIGRLGKADMIALNRAAVDFLGLAASPVNSF